MTVELWIGQEFKTTHERRAFDQFATDMEAKFSHSKQLYLVMANYSLEGREIDLTVLKRDAIIVIELKECPDPLATSENGDWLTIPDKKIISTGDQNPYQQAKDYRLKWANFLKRNGGKFLSQTKVSSMNFMHTSAFVVISPSLHPHTKNNIPTHLPWFRLVGLDKLSQAIGQQTSWSLNFSDQELRKLVVDVLHLKKFNPNDLSGSEPTNTRWLDYCRSLLTTHQNWTTSKQPKLYLSPEQMDIAPAKVICDKKGSKEFRLQLIPEIEQALKDFEPTVIKSALHGILESGSSETKDLLSLVDESDRPVILLGYPGLGKSVAMERLALKYAERFLQDQQIGYVPILIRLRDYDSRKRDLRNLVRIKLQGEMDTPRILRTEKLLLLFDGLDEAPQDSDIVPEIETFIEEYPHHRYVISSRPNVYRASPNRIIGCREVELQELTSEEAARLWRSFVDEPDFDNLPEKVQTILRVPLLLRLCGEIPQRTLVRVKTEAQLMDLIVRKRPNSLKPPVEDREVVERCLFRLALKESYSLDRERVFEAVTDYLAGESKSYQQKIMTALFKHPLLISTDDYISFWHLAFKDYFAARGLEDAIFKQGDWDLVLCYLGDQRWDDTIVYLAQILDEASITRLIEYLLDFNKLVLAFRCIRQVPSVPESTVIMVANGLAEAIMNTIKEIFEEVSPEKMGHFLSTGVPDYLLENLSDPKARLLVYINCLKEQAGDWQGVEAILFWESYLQTPESNPYFRFFHTAAAIGLARLEGEQAEELLLALLDHQEAQVRLVAVLGLLYRERYRDTMARKMMYDPNPIVAHVATRYLLPFPDLNSGRQFRLMIENLITPLAGKISEEMLFSFAEFTSLAGRLNSLVNPYAFQDELNFLGYVLLEQGAMGFGYYVDESKEREDKIAALLGGITAMIWVVGLVASGKVSLSTNTAAPHQAVEIHEWIEQTEELLIAWIKVTEEGQPCTDYPELGGKLELTYDNIAYIKSWTDHDLTREIAAEVLAGHYKPRLKAGD